MSMLRKRSAQYKIHLPENSRENQYLLAKFRVSDELVEKYKSDIDPSSDAPYQQFYQRIANILFDACNEFGIDSCQFVGNDKFTRVRYCPERFTSQTEQQILFFYNPKYHFNQNAHFDGTKLSRKITLVFLANGENLRYEAANFHLKVMKALNVFIDQVGLEQDSVRVCDHQHVTYDLFAKAKGVATTSAHKLRAIGNRYKSRDVDLKDEHDELTYAIVDLPVTRRLLALSKVDANSPEKYNPLYTMVADAFTSAAKQHNLHKGAIVANGLVPIVRESREEKITESGELQIMGYNATSDNAGISCKWSANKLVDTIQLIFIASEYNKADHGYGRFLHQVENALEMMAEQLNYDPKSEEMIVRFHQHIGFFK